MPRTFVVALLALALPACPAPAPAQPPPPDSSDFGDAPEGIPCHPDGALGRFPTCLTPGLPGTRESALPPISTAPGPTGYVRHLPSLAGTRYWLGCGPASLDFEADGKVNTPAGGASACAGVATDVVETPLEWSPAMSFDQDEKTGDGTDAGLSWLYLDSRGVLVPQIQGLKCTNEGLPTTAYLNVLVDMNEDGDWNDNFVFGAAGFEWAVKNYPATIAPGCQTLDVPPFVFVRARWEAPYFGRTWARITLSDEPVDDDFPWAGSASLPGGALHGGETEDYPAVYFEPDPVQSTSWGRLKTIYR